MTTPPDFETFCAEILNEPISQAWVVCYKALEGQPLGLDEQQIYFLCTGRTDYMPRVYTDFMGIVGRRGEKTQTAIKFLLWKIRYAGWEKQRLRQSWFSRIGRHTELLRVPLIAQDLRVSNDIQRVAESLILNSPLEAEVAEIYRNEIVFNNGIAFMCLPASKASVRGMTCPAVLLDELAWVSIDSADDKELVRQVKPSMIQFGQSRRLLKLSTPWLRSGLLYEEYSRRAELSETLVWRASTATMTPRIDATELERERLADPVYFAREYLAEFTDDIAAFIPAPDISAAVQSWRELPPVEGPFYLASLDASGLSGGDRFTFCIGHTDKSSGAHVVDLLRGWRRAPAAQVLDEIATLCRAYRIRNVIGDQYAATFVAELLRVRGIGFAQLAFSARSKPEVHFALKNALAAGTFRIPNHPDAVREVRALESQRTSGGAYRIGAPRGENDDYATVLALLAYKIANSRAKEPQIRVMRLDAPLEAPRNPQQLADSYPLDDPRCYGPERIWSLGARFGSRLGGGNKN